MIGQYKHSDNSPFLPPIYEATDEMSLRDRIFLLQTRGEVDRVALFIQKGITSETQEVLPRVPFAANQILTISWNIINLLSEQLDSIEELRSRLIKFKDALKVEIAQIDKTIDNYINSNPEEIQKFEQIRLFSVLQTLKNERIKKFITDFIGKYTQTKAKLLLEKPTAGLVYSYLNFFLEALDILSKLLESDDEFPVAEQKLQEALAANPDMIRDWDLSKRLEEQLFINEFPEG